LKEKRHRRVPVYADTPDQILGIIDVKLFLLDPWDHYTEKLIPPSFIAETMRAVELLKRFLTHPQGMGVVVDEFGGIEGIITMEDIVEEILSGTVPRDGSEFYIEPLGNGKFLVSGNARLDDLTEHLGFQIDAEGIDTIGGFVFTRLGYVPSSGTKLEIPGLRSQSVAPRARESKKSCWRKPQTHSRRRHDGRDHHHCLLLDHFVFL
jgi:Hemolysins and related proteins containing CBS domains